MNFQELLDAQRTGQLAGLPEDWGQGRTLFGGMMAALLLDAMRQQVPAERCLRALSISFIAPAALGQGMQVEVELLREGRAVSQLLARASQDGQVVALLQGSFGASRLSQVQVAGLPAPSFKAAEVCQRMPWLPGITPNFTQHFDMRWAVGGLPFSGNLSREMGGWVSFADAQLADQRLDECHLLGLVDAWPPALLPHLKAPAAGSSLTWTIEFMQPLQVCAANSRFAYLATIEHAADGYGHVAAGLWDSQGRQVAISRQTVTVFA